MRRDPDPLTVGADRLAVVGWSSFVRNLRWHQGEHVTIIGPTGRGKSWLASRLLPLRRFALVVATKPRDATLDRYRADGYRIIRTWPPPPLRQRVVLWPRLRHPSDVAGQRAVIADALDDVFARGGWTVYVDELGYVADTLRLGNRLDLLWKQGRSLGVSLVACTQRPAHVPLVAYSQASHLFIQRTNDGRDLQRLGDFGAGFDPALLRDTVAQLPPYAFAHVSRDGAVTVSRAPDPSTYRS